MTDVPAVTRRYFAASNSCRGFCNYFDDCFRLRHAPPSPDAPGAPGHPGGLSAAEGGIDRLYIIKGGPGTGKSQFMKSVARSARSRGYHVTEYACSSDPASLDGVILRCEGRPALGLLDGTAPHVREPTIPGVWEEIINLGEFWDARRLRGAGERIGSLSARKSEAYKRAYAYLRAYGDMEAVTDSLVEPAVRTDKLAALSTRLLRGMPMGTGFQAVPALRRAVSMTGKTCFHTFEWEADTVVVAEDYYGIGARLTDALLRGSKERRLRVMVSYDPICPHKIDGLFYPDNGFCLLIGEAEPPATAITRTLSLRRYADPDILREVRGELRHLRTLRDRLCEGALQSLSEVAVHHFELEKIYTDAMDFPAKEAFTEAFCRRLFEETENGER